MDYIKSDSLAQKRNRRFRIVILVLVLVFSTALGVLHQHPIGWKPAGVDAFCPFGGIESALSLVTTGRMLSRIAWSSFTLLGAVLLLAVLFRRSFCGNLCPFGTLQELFGMLGKKIFGKRYELNAKIDKTARFLIGSMFLGRVFCKYLCPMGAFLGLINRFGSFRVKRNDETCIHCKKCDKACPVNIKVSAVEQVQASECINCNECVNVCPVRDTLYVGNRRRRKSELVRSFLYPLCCSQQSSP